ncbi:O-antigen ligase like membrane protein [Corynebacterium mustelae]|uniref:O-antigen ligase like membrane protein n=1 Tax=Corynebacterium mustelae TaxID=571915 RepID=A0A0G3GUJ7_9CORY|nr:O-antigen ligase family protein [Corynebacterium mustelae]AKK04819.1 O-antigen ligase like membrane protein [Corynebacterium mustelae]
MKAAAYDRLPAWPVLLPFSAYALWWVLGIGDFVWIFAAVIMVAAWIGVRGLRLPTVMLVWLLFLLWVVASLPMTDTGGRLLGAIYRLLLYGSATVFALYVFNARRHITVWRVTGAMVWFLAGMTVCGYLALALPELSIRTPMAWIMPEALARNDLIGDMIIRRTTQWKADAWVPQAVRPAAPFLYANTWGNVYSLVLPLALLHLWLAWYTQRRWWIIAVVVLSIYPALSTLNRGMFIGLGVVAVWVAIQAIRRGQIYQVIGFSVSGAIAAMVWYFSPAAEAFFDRVEVTNSTADRGELYLNTFYAVVDSPLFGYGSPRPAAVPWLPSMGTQGQLWTVLYSHGFVGLLLFMVFLIVLFLLSIPRIDPVGAVLGGVLAATIVETTYYGMMTGIMVTMVAVGLILRNDTAVNSGDRPGIVVQPASRRRRQAKTPQS